VGVSRLPGVSTGPPEARGGENDTCSKRRGRGRKERSSKALRPHPWCVSWNEGRHAAELVTPELTLVRVADKEALNKYATARTAAGAGKHLKANLSQLFGFDLLTRLEMIAVGSTGAAGPMLTSSKCGRRRVEWR
jgi:hypothetical protein